MSYSQHSKPQNKVELNSFVQHLFYPNPSTINILINYCVYTSTFKAMNLVST